MFSIPLTSEAIQNLIEIKEFIGYTNTITLDLFVD